MRSAIFATSRRGTDAETNVRVDDPGAFSRLDGAESVSCCTRRPARRTVPTTTDLASPSSPLPPMTESINSPGRANASASALTANEAVPGGGPGIQTSTGNGATSGSSSQMSSLISAPPPSIRHRCDLVRIANPPSSSPSIRYISHSGRLRSRGRDITRDTRSSRSAIVPGDGKPDRRMWKLMSKSGSSAQTGRARPRVTSRTTFRYRGTSCSRFSTSRTSAG
ncbi:Uncharacterised protein [Mycobacteroides abscessus subsp. abscessus]|nr:Uncharacterised protein [Mycobacteroides abscessus subsp. abscessus]